MFNKDVLNNGLRIITSDMPAIRSLCIAVFLGVGSRYESDDDAGVSHFIEHMCFKGTHRRPTSKEIAETIEGVGGMVNGGTGKEFTVFWSKVARPHFALALDLLVDMLRCSKFDADDMERERRVILEELKDSLDSPSDRVGQLVNELMWQEQQLGKDIIGSRESIRSMDLIKVRKHMNSFYGPNNAVVAIAGDLDHADICSQVAEAFDKWDAVVPRPFAPVNDRQQAPRLRIEYKDTEQAHICLGIKGMAINNPDRYILDLLNVVLGGGMSSRLNLEIRERLGLVYDIDSYVDYYFDSGSLMVYAGTDPKNVKDTVAAIVEELAGLKKRVPAAELSKVKELVKGRLLLGMEDTRSVASWGGRQEALTGELRTVDEVVSIIEKIGSDDMVRVAEQLLVADRLSLAIVGPVSGEERFLDLLKL